MAYQPFNAIPSDDDDYCIAPTQPALPTALTAPQPTIQPSHSHHPDLRTRPFLTTQPAAVPIVSQPDVGVDDDVFQELHASLAIPDPLADVFHFQIMIEDDPSAGAEMSVEERKALNEELRCRSTDKATGVALRNYETWSKKKYGDDTPTLKHLAINNRKLLIARYVVLIHAIYFSCFIHIMLVFL